MSSLWPKRSSLGSRSGKARCTPSIWIMQSSSISSSGRRDHSRDRLLAQASLNSTSGVSVRLSDKRSEVMKLHNYSCDPDIYIMCVMSYDGGAKEFYSRPKGRYLRHRDEKAASTTTSSPGEEENVEDDDDEPDYIDDCLVNRDRDPHLTAHSRSNELNAEASTTSVECRLIDNRTSDCRERAKVAVRISVEYEYIGQPGYITGETNTVSSVCSARVNGVHIISYKRRLRRDDRRAHSLLHRTWGGIRRSGSRAVPRCCGQSERRILHGFWRDHRPFQKDRKRYLCTYYIRIMHFPASSFLAGRVRWQRE